MHWQGTLSRLPTMYHDAGRESIYCICMTHVSLQPIGASAIRSCILFLTLPISMVLVALTFCLSSFIWEKGLPFDFAV